MTVEEVNKKIVLVGIRVDEYARELLDWALVKVADPGDCVTALHIHRNSDSKVKGLLDSYLDDYEGLCSEKQIDLIGEVQQGFSMRKVLVKEAKTRAATAVVVGISKPPYIGCWASVAKYCAKKLPSTTEVLAVHNGKVVFRRFCTGKLSGPVGDPKPSIYLHEAPSLKDGQSEFGDSEISEIERNTHEKIRSFEDRWIEDVSYTKDEELSTFPRHKKSLSAVSTFTDFFFQERPGWPLLRAGSIATSPVPEAREMSVVQWVMNLPNRSSPSTPGSSSSLDSANTDLFFGSESTNKGNTDDIAKVGRELPEALELLQTNSSGCRWFSHEVLKSSTSQFSSGYLIGKGGCSSVYKGVLPEGKTVAIKLLNSSREAWKEFSKEVDIMTSLNHQYISPLLGVCVEENNLISVYEYMARGNLEENLHSTSKNLSVLSWEVRFNVAVGIAEALNYLHDECCRPVIHRDIKSSNILLTEDYKPLLSDFGLAIWGPTSSSFLTHTDVLGTFGYLAPEYFMYGKVSDKIDVYSFGVVLLELLSGKKAIGFESPKGQESLVIWAKPVLENGDVMSILDPNLEKHVNKDHIQRMALAAVLCLTRAARLRPKMSQILKVLRGEKDVDSQSKDQIDSDNQVSNDDEVYPESIADLSLALLDVDEDPTLCSSIEGVSSQSLDEYLKGVWS